MKIKIEEDNIQEVPRLPSILDITDNEDDDKDFEEVTYPLDLFFNLLHEKDCQSAMRITRSCLIIHSQNSDYIVNVRLPPAGSVRGQVLAAVSSTVRFVIVVPSIVSSTTL